MNTLSIAQLNELLETVSPRLGLTAEINKPPQFWEDAMQAEWLTAKKYAALKARSRRAGRVFHSLHEEQMKIVKRIASFNFLKTGRRPKLKECVLEVFDTLDELRECYLWERGRANLYRTAVLGNDMAAGDLLIDLGGKKETHAKTLYALIEDMVL